MHTKGERNILFGQHHFHQTVSTSKSPTHCTTTTRLKRMATLASILTFVAFLACFCLFFQSGTSASEADDLQRVQRSLLGVPSPSVASRFSLSQQRRVVDNKNVDNNNVDNNEAVLPAIVKQSDIFLSVKTTKQFHRTRLDLILKTWFQLAREETYFFTDDKDEEFDIKTSKFRVLKIISKLKTIRFIETFS